MKILGANWRTSASGYSETVCLIVIAICLLPSETWSNPKVWIPAICLIVAKTIKDSVTKDRQVQGGTVQQDEKGAVAEPQLSIPHEPKPAVPLASVLKKAPIVLLCCALLFNSCTTDQLAKSGHNAVAFANSPAGQAIIKTAVSGIIIAGMSAGTQYADTGKVSSRVLVRDELYGSQQNLYALIGTPAVNSSAAIVAAVNQGGGNLSATQAIAPTVAANVKAQINQGIAPDIAVQKAADALGAAPAVAVLVEGGASPQVTVNNVTAVVAQGSVITPQ